MLNILIGIIAIIGCVATYLYLKGKKQQPVSEKTSVGKIVHTVTSKFERSMNEFAEMMRSPSVVKEEIIAKLKSSQAELKKETEEDLVLIQTSINQLTESKGKMETQISSYNNKAISAKQKWIETQDSADKELAMMSLSQSLRLTELKNAMESRLKKLDHQYVLVVSQYEKIKFELELKGSEILLLFSDPQISRTKFFDGINSLVSEYSQKMTAQNIVDKVQDDMGLNSDTSSVPEVDLNILNDEFEKL